MSRQRSEVEQKKLKINQLQAKIKKIKENVTTTRKTLRGARRELKELIELEKAAIIDEEERIDKAGGDIRAALGKDKYGSIILPGSFWSDVYITRRNREILAPGLRNTIKRSEKNLARYEQELIETRKELLRLKINDWADVFSVSSVQIIEAGEPQIEEALPQKDELPYSVDEIDTDIALKLTAVVEKSAMLDRLKEVDNELIQSFESISKKESEKLKISAELAEMRSRLASLDKVIDKFTEVEGTSFYQFIEFMYGFFGFETKRRQQYNKNQGEAETLRKKIAPKEIKLQEVDAMLADSRQKKSEFLNEQALLQKEVGGMTKEQVHELMLQIIFRDKVPEIKKLIKKCEEFRLDYVGQHFITVNVAVNQVKAALKQFLGEPSRIHLDKLNQALQDNAMYSKSFSLYRLVKDSSIFYPEIKMTMEALLPMSPFVLEEEVGQQIQKNKEELITLQRSLAEIEEGLKGQDPILLSKALQNKASLENAYIMRVILRKTQEIFIQDHPLAPLKKSLSDTTSTAIKGKIHQEIEKNEMVVEQYEQKIRDIEIIIKHIQTNLLEKNVDEVKKKMDKKIKDYQKRKVIDPFIQDKTQAERLELLELLNQVVVVSIQIEDAEVSIDMDIPYTVDPKLKSVIIPPGASEKIEQRERLRERISILEGENRTFEEDALCVTQALQATQLNTLIERCRKQTLLNNPTTKALGRFLMIPTQRNLNILVDKMEKDPSYINNDKLLPILQDASGLYPVLKQHIGIRLEKPSVMLSGALKMKEGLKAIVSSSREEVDSDIKPKSGF